ncbi:sulfite exporter TauE/SafE family protein [Thalassospira lucentensis]|uniref:sulfite exporter TauE/SafE family protein n=1 Tax=Thalassospira lucentensis TaxID=168935 RepID=UPI003AA9C400
MPISTVIITGLLMGLASSLHCAGMCGAIAASILTAGRGTDASPKRQLTPLILMQIGRAATYIVAGLLLGAMGGLFDSLLITSSWQPVMRVTAGVIVIYAGLTIAGVVPALARLDRFLPVLTFAPRHRPALAGINPQSSTPATTSTSTSANAAAHTRPNPFGNIALGAALGLTPCAMVYNALLTSMLTGSVSLAGLFMACFALAALPAVILSALGISTLRHMGQNQNIPHLRIVIAVALVFVGGVTLAEPAMGFVALCLT